MISAIVLAAGQSRRMGCQKLLLPFGGHTVIAHVVGAVLGSAVEETCIVVGRGRDRIAEALAGSGVIYVTNPDSAGDMLSSVRCGLRALSPHTEAILVVLGDQPGITSTLIDEMIRAFAAAQGGIIVPVHAGQRGHPLLLSAIYREEILTGYGDVGLRGLLHAHPDAILELSAATPAVLSDIDTPQDYRRALARASIRAKRKS